MRNRVSRAVADNAVRNTDILDAISEVLQSGGIAEVKMESRGNEQHVTVVNQERKLIEDVLL